MQIAQRNCKTADYKIQCQPFVKFFITHPPVTCKCHNHCMFTPASYERLYYLEFNVHKLRELVTTVPVKRIISSEYVYLLVTSVRNLAYRGLNSYGKSTELQNIQVS